MIGSLKRKVFWSILLSAAGVLLVILLEINVLRWTQTASKKESILDSALMMLGQEEGIAPGDPGPESQAPGETAPEDMKSEEAGPGKKDFGKDRERFRDGKGRAELLRSASEGELGVLLLAEDGSVSESAGCAEQLEEETVSAIAAAAQNDANGRGQAEGWDYKVLKDGRGTVVSFLDAASLRRENLETALVSLAAFALACGLFALLARALSRAIVRPVEENTEAQKRFVADASHELKTPLTVIDANASVLEQSIGQNKWLDYIKEQTGRMAGLVNELLELSHLEEAKGSDAPKELEVYDAAEAVLAAALPFESVAFERGVTLETETPDELEVYGSRKDLEQLAAILIDNAVKHSEDGGTVEVVLERTKKRHGRREAAGIRLRVKNRGDGIPAEALPHIFDRFYRVDESRANSGNNSYGLGLAIAKELAERDGGTIGVTSDLGVTKFTLVLPAEK